MKLKDINIFFQAVRKGDILKVNELINSNIEFINVCNIAPPKNEDGQSGLQVSFRTGNFDIAKFLIEQGSNINFIEKSTINEWNTPVLHDCIRATIFNTYTLQKDSFKFDKAFSLLQLILSKHADPNAVDSYGNNCLHRAILDANQMINHPDANLNNGILLQQLRCVFKELINSGADINKINKLRPSAISILIKYKLDQYQLC